MKNYLSLTYSEFPENFDAGKYLEDWKINNNYDPDTGSEELYDDLNTVIFPRHIKEQLSIKEVKKVYKESKYWLEMYFNNNTNDEFFGLGADFIGPSIYQALKANLSNSEIIKFLEESRTLGGHMLWPRNGQNSINPVRGFYSYKDRIDLMLFALKLWFNGKQSIITCNEIRNVLNENKEWLTVFEKLDDDSFRGFIDIFKLNSFVNKEYDVYDLTTFIDGKKMKVLESDNSTVPKDYDTFMKYVKGNCYCIEKRNKVMNEELFKNQNEE